MKFTTSVVALSCAILASAMPGGHPVTTTVTVTAPGPTTTVGSSCNTGPIQCCNSVQQASDSGVGAILGLLGIVLQDLNVLVGLNCSPITVIGGGSAGCTAHPVCCQNNDFHGLINIGCIPINISL
jgi:hypothetical protein